MTVKVGFVSIFYPLFMGRYMLEALLRRKDCEVWTAGPYTGRWIPWQNSTNPGGMNLPARYVHTPNYPMPRGSPSTLSWKQIESLEKPFEPDIWINVSSTLKTIGRPEKGVYAVIAADPHVLDYDEERGKSDLFFNMQKPYMKPGDRWLPYGYDPIWHAQTTIPFLDRKFDVALLGLPYPNRNELIERLRGELLNAYYDLGPCYDDARDIYHETRIGLNWSSKQDTTARVFEIMAFGIAPVLNRVPDLVEMFVENEHFKGFSNLAEAIAQVKWCLANPDEADALGKNARLAVQDHSWDARMQTVLEEADLVHQEVAGDS